SRGIPCLYYGTEQGLHDDTNAQDGLPHGNNDPYNRPMMAKWDTDAPVYRMLGVLTQLRRLNPAISLGRHVALHVSPDVYVYLRRYRNSYCLVALNKGETLAKLDALPAELPDRRYMCFLTKRRITVKDGKILRLRIAPKEAIVLSHVGPVVRARTVVRAQVNGLATKPGEVVVVTGDCPELGRWDISKAYRLEYLNSNTWFGEIPFDESAGKPIAYKYAICRLDEYGALTDPATRENIVCRRWVIARKGIVKWRDRWGG
ncbi:MAG TPA: carbohydrate-binding module family 20 domain-containing protein, partial [Opitutaceae bacterium]